MRLTRLVFVCLLLSLVAPLSALAADRMYVGFQDDPSFRWREDRHAVIDEAGRANASVAPHDRLLVARRAAATVPRLEPERSGIPLERPRRARPQRAARGHGDRT